MDRRLTHLADAVLQPGFVGHTPPDWLRRRLADGLGSVLLYARNIHSPEQVAALTAALRAESPDVVICIDEEAGDVTRLEAHIGSSRPGNLALGAADDPELTTAVAHHLGLELAALGITLDYAPDADVNSNPDNPVIGVRAFGSDPELVARHTAAWVRGLQTAGVAACAKHFPGHGDTGIDSHHDVPLIAATRAQLESVELAPFRAAIAAGARAIMTGHLVVPAIDPDRPATLSRAVLTGLLRDELGFTGLIVTDAIEMQAVARRYGLVGATIAALHAGADAVCVGGEHADEQTAIDLRDGIVAAVRSGRLSEQRLEEAAARLRAVAAWNREHRSPAPVPDQAIGSGSSHPGLAAARRALGVRVDGGPAPWPLSEPAFVLELSPAMNMAIAPETPWGVLAPLAALLPGTIGARIESGDADPVRATADALAAAAGRPLIVVVRDAHRHPWIAAALARVYAARPDAIAVEMGVPASPIGAAQIVTYGATSASGLAVAELLSGRAAAPSRPANVLAR